MKIQEYNVAVDGFRGQLYDPENKSDKVLIVFMGGESKFISAGLLAEKFAENGYAALALYYWKGTNLPQCLSMVPLDMVEKALIALKGYNSGQFEKVATYGISMGSILALMSSVEFGEISAVIAVSPTHIIPEGFQTKKSTSGESFLTYQGKPYDYTSIDDTLPMYQYFEKAYKAKDMVAIPVEKIKGSIFLLAGAKDSSWPSSFAVNSMKQRIDEVGQHKEARCKEYENGGHFIGVMPDMRKYKRLNLMRLMSKDELLHPKACAQARSQSENDVFSFLANW